MSQKQQFRKNRSYSKNEEPKVDSSSISKFVILTVIFCSITALVNHIVMKAIHLSPTSQVGNGMISLYEIHNNGAAFNLFQGEVWLLIAIAVIAILIMFSFILINSKNLSHNAISSMALLSAGILINMIQRIQQGFVTDYIHLDFYPAMPMFNTADIFIVCGVIGVLPALLLKRS